MTNRTYTVGSVCSGIGTFDTAFEQEGAKTIWSIEKDANCRAVLRRHFPETEIHDDFTTVDFGRLVRPDILIGGTPCQAFSVAGLRNSLDDARGNLTLLFARLVNELDPEVVLWENVPGVLSTKDNAFGCFLASLVGADSPLVPNWRGGRWTNAGLVVGPKRSAAWIVKDARHYGVPQRRRRVFVVVCASPERASQILLERESLCGDTAEGEGEGQGAACETGCCFAPSSFGGYSPGVGPKRSNTGGVSGGTENIVVAMEPVCLTPWDSQRFREHGTVDCPAPTLSTSDGGGGQRTLAILDESYSLYDMTHCDDVIREVKDGIVPTLQARMGTGGNQVPLVGETRNLIPSCWVPSVEIAAPRVARQGKGGFTDPVNDNVIAFSFEQPVARNGRGNCSDTVNALRSSSTTGDSAPCVVTASDVTQKSMIVRRLMPVECERLQGLPDEWTDFGVGVNGGTAQMSDSTRYKMCGNAGAVPVIQWLAGRILKAMGN